MITFTNCLNVVEIISEGQFIVRAEDCDSYHEFCQEFGVEYNEGKRLAELKSSLCAEIDMIAEYEASLEGDGFQDNDLPEDVDWGEEAKIMTQQLLDYEPIDYTQFGADAVMLEDLP